MKHTQGHREIIISSTVLAIVFICVVATDAEVYLPTERANAYVTSLEPLIEGLKKSISELSESTQSPLFDNPDLTPEQKIIAISQIEELITHINAQLSQVEKHDTDLGSLGLAEPLGLTARASEIRKQLPYSISQTREVITAYTEMITYIKQRLALDTQLSAHLQEFNSIQDFDLLIGQGDTWMKKRKETDSLLTQLQALTIPIGFEAVHAEAASTYAHVSNDFGQFATILLTPSESTLDVIARDIEAITEQHENSDANSLFNAFDKSPTLSDVAQLTDKFERY